LKFISEKEWIEVDDESYNYIANHSNWGLRNAISLYEQLISNNKIKFDEVKEKLWLIWEDELKKFLNELLAKDREVMKHFEFLIESWKNIRLFFREFIFFVKNEIIKKLGKWEDIKELLNIIEILDETYSKTKNSFDENTTFMIGILKIVE
jgi:DNA polymerase III gamma/tau subunit